MISIVCRICGRKFLAPGQLDCRDCVWDRIKDSDFIQWMREMGYNVTCPVVTDDKYVPLADWLAMSEKQQDAIIRRRFKEVVSKMPKKTSHPCEPDEPDWGDV